MEVSQVALARMILSCLLGGLLMGVVHELLMFPLRVAYGDMLPSVLRWKTRLSLPANLCPRKRKPDHEKAPRGEMHGGRHDWQGIFKLVFIALVDTLFCLLCAVLLLLLLYDTNQGEFRWIALAMLVLGIWFSRATLSPPIAWATQMACVCCSSAVMFVLALVAYPFWRFFSWLWKKTAKIRSKFYNYWKNKYHEWRKKATQKKQRKKQLHEHENPAVSDVDSVLTARQRAPYNGRTVFCTGRTYEDRKR